MMLHIQPIKLKVNHHSIKLYRYNIVYTYLVYQVQVFPYNYIGLHDNLLNSWEAN